jgi:hypothetical protein
MNISSGTTSQVSGILLTLIFSFEIFVFFAQDSRGPFVPVERAWEVGANRTARGRTLNIVYGALLYIEHRNQSSTYLLRHL